MLVARENLNRKCSISITWQHAIYFKFLNNGFWHNRFFIFLAPSARWFRSKRDVLKMLNLGNGSYPLRDLPCDPRRENVDHHYRSTIVHKLGMHKEKSILDCMEPEQPGWP